MSINDNKWLWLPSDDHVTDLEFLVKLRLVEKSMG